MAIDGTKSMAAKHFRLNFSTAYGQLILLVFLPICVLAMVGGVLVWQDTSRAARTIQRATADNLINRYQLVANGLQPDLEAINQTLIRQVVQSQTQFRTKSTIPLSPQQLLERQAKVKTLLQKVTDDKHLEGFAIVNDYGQVLVSFGDTTGLKQQLPNVFAANESKLGNANAPNQATLSNTLILNKGLFGQNTVSEIANPGVLDKLFLDNSQATLFGKRLQFINQQTMTVANPPSSPTSSPNTPLSEVTPVALWMLVNVDNEPLQIARYQVIIALVITGLLTILLLLLTINVYARRWIAPIYEMRLHLQRTNANNLYKPMTITSSGEINQLQQDLVKTLRRLHTSFQELKNHAEQTEDDLRLAFDEMEMQNISIRNARDAAISASQTKSAFLANISHELRTPLNSIDGFINLLSRHGGLSAEQDLYVQTIRKSSAHLLALVNDVLDFSKIEAGKLVLDSHEFDLYDIIYDVVDMLSPLAAEKGLRVAVIFYDDVPRQLMGDALRVKQVLTNLVNNAIKFTDEGEVLVRVGLDDVDDFINICVKDTGRGIDPEHQKVLFQSFSQGDPSITRQYGGTGLGLVISKQLTFLMGGTIGFYDNKIHNDENTPLLSHPPANKLKGTTFWFTLPMHLTDTEQQRLLTHTPMWQLPQLASNATTQFNNAHQTKTALSILVWIDHPATLQVLRGSLRELSIDLKITQSLAGLLEQLKETGNHWDWVIADTNTNEDTISLLKQIRLHYAGKLALFGYQINLDPALLTRYHAHALYQPLDRRQLYQLLDSESVKYAEPSLPQWHGFRVLAVDDHPPNLLVLEALLAELGIEVVSVNSGFEAIDYISSQPAAANSIDLIFMDIQMPKMSGSEAASRIRHIEQQQQRSPIPIVALTAHSLSDEREKLLASGIDDYVGKPINQSQLLQILQRWLGKTSENAHLSSLPSANLAQKSAFNSEADNTNTNSHPLSLSYAPHIEPNYQTQTNQAKGENAKLDKAEKFELDLSRYPVIDWQDALSRVAGKSDLAVNLLVMLLDSIDQEKADLSQAWQNYDRKTLAAIAHRILGASRYTGVPQLRKASQKLEDKCLLNINHPSPAQFAMLLPYYEALLVALDNLKHADLTAYPDLRYARLNENDMAWKMI